MMLTGNSTKDNSIFSKKQTFVKKKFYQNRYSKWLKVIHNIPSMNPRYREREREKKMAEKKWGRERDRKKRDIE